MSRDEHGGRAILVLGARVRPDGTPSPALAARARHGAHLALADPGALLVLSGGVVGHPPAEAAAAAILVRAEGVPEARILIEDRSTSTVENLVNARAMLAPLAIDRVKIVTDPLHLPRALAVARILGLSATGAAAPARARPMARARMALREAAALVPTMIRAVRACNRG